MICPRCGVMVEEGNETCFNCGSPLTQQYAYFQQPFNQPSFQPPQQYSDYHQHYKTDPTLIRGMIQRKTKKEKNRKIGWVLIIIGIVFIPIAIITAFMPIVGWIFCPAAGICLLAGIITIASNLSKSNI
jgi:uncharacterized membrane protein YvbJ